MKVYVLELGRFERRRIVGVFDSLKAAKAEYARRYPKRDQGWGKFTNGPAWYITAGPDQPAWIGKYQIQTLGGAWPGMARTEEPASMQNKPMIYEVGPYHSSPVFIKELKAWPPPGSVILTTRPVSLA